MTNKQAANKLLNILNDDIYSWSPEILEAFRMAVDALKGVNGDSISRQAAIDRINGTAYAEQIKENMIFILRMLPSAQPERTCVNCGRTVNNGGWYADGGTRCPIEEHYALPKDGYCHLWEKRNVTDDDYPERRTDDCKDNV